MPIESSDSKRHVAHPMHTVRYGLPLKDIQSNPLIDDLLYFTDDYVEHLVKTNQNKLIILVSSWSESIVEHARSINLGSRQCRDIVHHILLAQKLKKCGIKLVVKYFAFNNEKHFNYKNPKSVDNTISKSYIEYICSFLGLRLGVDLDEDQFQPIYLNPRFVNKDGDYTSAELPDTMSVKGQVLFCSGPNAKTIEQLRDELIEKKRSGYKVLGMTAHSGGPNLRLLVEYLGTELIGIAEANQELGTKPGNKALFMELPVKGGITLPIAYGTTVAKKDLDDLYEDCYNVALESGAKRILVKLTSSSAGNGNAFIDLRKCFNTDKKLDKSLVKETVKEKLIEMKFIEKIKSSGAIVEERLEGENITSPGVLAVVTKSGKVSVLYKYDQVLGDGNFFGGSIGPTSESKEIQDKIDKLTIEVGKRIHRSGGYGYFGLDFFVREVIENEKKVKKVDVIEANIRKTGTLYPWLSALHLLGKNLIDKKTISQDDKIELPLKMSDLTGRRDMKNLYMSGLYRYLQKKSVIKFNHDTKTGAFVTFNTHTADKIGVLFIGNSRDHIDSIKETFKSELATYTNEVFIAQIAKNNPSCKDLVAIQRQHRSRIDTSAQHTFKESSEVTTKRAAKQPTEPLQLSTRHQPTIKRDHIAVASQRALLKARGMSESIKGGMSSATNGLTHALGLRRRPVSSLNTAGGANSSPAYDLSRYYQSINDLKKREQTFISTSPDIVYGDKFVFGIFGRTNTNNDLLVMAAKHGKMAYRFTPDSEFWFDRKIRKGKIKNVHIALYDNSINDYKVVQIDNHWFDLPTIVYNYDFTATRRGVYQAQGDRTITDKVHCAKTFINMIGAVPFNSDKEGTTFHHFMSATRSQSALYNLCSKNSELYGLYPETRTITRNLLPNSPELAFINRHNQFYIKPGVSERKVDSNLGNIFVSKHANDQFPGLTYLLFTYACRTEDGDYYSVTKKQYLKDLTGEKAFLDFLNTIKSEMGYDEDEQFLFQEYLQTPDVYDKHGKSLTKKIRVVTQRAIHPETGEVFVRASSVYGLYGGPNSYLGYVGDPNIYIDQYLKSSLSQRYKCTDRVKAVENELFARAVTVHQEAELELDSNGKIGEAIVDFILSNNGPIPLKISIKPERADLSAVNTQSHLKQYLEANGDCVECDQKHRDEFLRVLTLNQSERNQRVIEYAEKVLHNQSFKKADTLRRKEIVGSKRVATYTEPAQRPSSVTSQSLHTQAPCFSVPPPPPSMCNPQATHTRAAASLSQPIRCLSTRQPGRAFEQPSSFRSTVCRSTPYLGHSNTGSSLCAPLQTATTQRQHECSEPYSSTHWIK